MDIRQRARVDPYELISKYLDQLFGTTIAQHHLVFPYVIIHFRGFLLTISHSWIWPTTWMDICQRARVDPYELISKYLDQLFGTTSIVQETTLDKSRVCSFGIIIPLLGLTSRRA
jgi:hypothetical protein